MKYFDAVVWLSAGRPISEPLLINTNLTIDSIISNDLITKSLFFVYFFLLTQARYPYQENNSPPIKVPKLLSLLILKMLIL